ncbi:12818_t:CDS:2 [Funneliformis mosseae]|uniref:12818_t:CDS:1 n=1 Tax=Funneliformis mosseae TaxID=27381 RepID=A0A9N8Z5H1_FUNMO|nr:12818_t:CDS:2 [Funneliformis mosseae]
MQGRLTLAKSFINDKSTIIDNATNNSNDKDLFRQPLQELNKIQDQQNHPQGLEELVSKMTADKVFINSIIIFNNSNANNLLA